MPILGLSDKFDIPIAIMMHRGISPKYIYLSANIQVNLKKDGTRVGTKLNRKKVDQKKKNLFLKKPLIKNTPRVMSMALRIINSIALTAISEW